MWSFLEQEITPDVVVEYLNSIGTNTVNGGNTAFIKVAEKYGLTCTPINNDLNKINEALDEGKVCIYSTASNSELNFTTRSRTFSTMLWKRLGRILFNRFCRKLLYNG